MAEVSEEMIEKGYRLCKDFLAGGWSKIDLEEFHIERMPGGLSNMMYLCILPEHVKSGKEPRKVLLRVYGQIIQENPETVVTDSVIFALLAEKRMGPKFYGVFTGGRIEEYVPSRHLHCDELRRPDISVACAKVMTGFHKLEMPLVKEPRWLHETITRYLDDALNNVSFDREDSGKKEQLQKILSFGLASEFQCMMKLVKKVNSPVVFCHNDMQEGNILFCEKADKWQLIPIDFEYASYNYRGFDIANHFCEWCYNYQVDTPPYYTAKIENYPTRDQQVNDCLVRGKLP
jgi:choline/ethanolamine kinase